MKDKLRLYLKLRSVQVVIYLTILGLLIVVGYYLTNSNDTTQPILDTESSITDSSGVPQSVESGTASQSTVYASSDKLVVTKVISDLNIPWDVSFTPDNVILINERAGRLIAKLPDGSLQDVEADFSDLSVGGELGLMGMVVDPNFTNNRRLYTCQGDRFSGEVKIVAWTISKDYSRASRVADPLLAGIPSASIHIGCRLRFGGDGHLWISTGDAAVGTNPQNLDSLAGKILRIDAFSGEAATNNPFSSSTSAELVYSYGHRNPQGLAWHKDRQQMWVVEHGSDIDDEINLLVAGGNYGWDPIGSSTYDQSVAMTDTTKYPQAIKASWSSGRPTLATSGAIFLEGDWWGSKEGWLAVATLKDSRLYLFEFDETGQFKNRYLVPELDKSYGRLRTPMMGLDQALYITTSNGNNNDFLLRLAPES